MQGVGKPQGKVQDPMLVQEPGLLIKLFTTPRSKGEEIDVTRTWKQGGLCRKSSLIETGILRQMDQSTLMLQKVINT